jgi:hypothetical protein
MTRPCKERQVYAIETGDFVGQMFVVVDIQDDYVGCLKLPDVENVEVPKADFERGRNIGIMKYIERLPRSVYSVSKAQYTKNKNEDSNN